MLSYYELRKGVQFIFEGQPYEVIEFRQMGKAQDVVVAQTKIRNLMNGKVIYKNFHQGDAFEEANVAKLDLLFLFEHRGKFVFVQAEDKSKRYEFTEEQLGDSAKWITSNQPVEGLVFQEKIINISVPPKVQLKVTESAPGIKGDRAQSGTKAATVETGIVIQVPLFVQMGDSIEVNTETGEYVRRIASEG